MKPKTPTLPKDLLIHLEKGDRTMEHLTPNPITWENSVSISRLNQLNRFAQATSTGTAIGSIYGNLQQAQQLNNDWSNAVIRNDNQIFSR